MKPDYSRNNLPQSAEEWMVKLLDEDLTIEELRAFQSWLKSDSRHRDSMRSHAKSYRLLKGLQSAQLPQEIHRLLEPKITLWSRCKERIWDYPKTAISVLLAALIIPLMHFWPMTTSPTEWVTSDNQKERAVLEDSSVVDLSENSKVTVVFDDRSRQATLESGEAYFNIAKDPDRPFLVITPHGSVKVLGTRFKLRLQDNSLEVVVAEGLVALKRETDTDFNRDWELSPGDRAILTNGGRQFTLIDSDMIALGQTRPLTIRFQDETLSNLVLRLNELGVYQYTIVDEVIKGYQVSGSLKINDIESIRFALNTTYGIEFVQDGQRIELRKTY